MKRITAWFVTFVFLCSFGCSVPDGGDRADLEKSISALPPSAFQHLKTWAVNELIRRLLRGHDKNRMVARLWCREEQPDGSWGDFSPREGTEITVEQVLICMLSDALDYRQCVRSLMDPHYEAALYQNGEDAVPIADCTHKYAHEFHPDRVAAEAKNKSEYSAGEYERLPSLITVSDMADGLIGSETPPPLPGGALIRLLPVLCPLVPWGCPGNPLYPGDQPTIATDDGADQ